MLAERGLRHRRKAWALFRVSLCSALTALGFRVSTQGQEWERRRRVQKMIRGAVAAAALTSMFGAALPVSGGGGSAVQKLQVRNLVTDYGVQTVAAGTTSSAIAATNTTAIQQAMTDVTSGAYLGYALYLPGSTGWYPITQLVIPSAPFTLYGDGPTQSTFVAATAGAVPLITYNPTVGNPAAGSPFGSSGSGATTQYRVNTWIFDRFGLTTVDGGANGQMGLSFPAWNISTQGPYRLTLWASNMIVSNMWGNAIDYQISGGGNDSAFTHVLAINNTGKGFNFGSDGRMVDCIAANNGYEGMYVNGESPMQIVGCKSWSNGTLTVSRGYGLYITGSPGGVNVTNLDTQDNFYYGVGVENASGVVLTGMKCDRDCAGNTVHSALYLHNCHDVIVNGLISTDSSGWTRTNPTGNQLHAVRVDDDTGTSNYNNYVNYLQKTTVGSDSNTATMGIPIDPASTGINGGTTLVNTGGANVARNWSTAVQTPTAATRTYVTGSQVKLPFVGGFRVGAVFRWRFNMTKTAAGTASSTIDIAVGTAGTTADTAVVSFTKPAGTAAIDEAFCEVECVVRGPISATGVLVGEFTMVHNGNTAGHATIPVVVVNTISGSVNLTTPTYIGLCITTGASDVISIQQCEAEVMNI